MIKCTSVWGHSWMKWEQIRREDPVYIRYFMRRMCRKCDAIDVEPIHEMTEFNQQNNAAKPDQS